MTCERVRDALSAMLDGEEPGADPAEVRRHVAGCQGCAAWERGWQASGGRLRVAPVEPVPDRAEGIVAAVRAARVTRRRRRQRPLRAALAAVGLGQLTLAAPELLLGHTHDVPQHVAHELGSFAVALSVAFLAAALRPSLAAGSLPVVGVTVAFLTLTAATDLGTSQAELRDELPHLLLVVGFLLLCRLAGATAPPDTPTPASAGPTPGPGWATGLRLPRGTVLPRVRRLAGEVHMLTRRHTHPRRARQLPRLLPPRTARVLAVVAVAVATALAVADPASAHATLSGSNPFPGQVLPRAPAAVRLHFSEPVTTVPGSLRVLGPDGDRADTGNVRHPGGDGGDIVVDLRPTRRGSHLVSWRVVSGDSHPVSGAFSFAIGTTSAAAGSATSDGGGPGIALVLGLSRWAGYLGLLLLLGGAVFLSVCWPAGWRQRRARLLLTVGWAVGLAAALLGLGVKGAYDAGLGLGQAGRWDLFTGVLATTYGKALAARLLLLAGIAVWLGLRAGTPRAPSRRAGAVVGLALLATFAAAGHAAAGSGRPLALLSDTLHLAAMAVWVGGLVLLATVLLPRRRPVEAAEAVPVFSRLAAGCVAVLVVTGGYQSWRQVGGLPALAGTTYGRELILKVGLVAVALSFGAASRTWVRRHYGRSPVVVYAASASDLLDPPPSDPPAEVIPAAMLRLRRSVAVEAAIAVLVLAVTAALVATAPARNAYRPSVEDDLRLGPVSAQLSAVPAGDREMDLNLHLSGRDGAPTDPEEVTATLRLPQRDLGPLPVTLRGAGPGHRIATIAVPVPGDWILTLYARSTPIDVYTKDVTLPIR